MHPHMRATLEAFLKFTVAGGIPQYKDWPEERKQEYAYKLNGMIMAISVTMARQRAATVHRLVAACDRARDQAAGNGGAGVAGH